MAERDIPSPRQVSLHEMLTTTTQQSKSRADATVGNSFTRREAGFMSELMAASNALATKWGVDPQQISTQRQFETRVVYYRKPIYQRPADPSEFSGHPGIPEDKNTAETVPVSQSAEPSPAEHQEQSLPDASTADPSEPELIVLINNVTPEADGLTQVKTLGKAVAELRRLKKLTQQQLADRIGCSKSRIDKGERGSRPFHASTVEDICDALEIIEGDDRRKVLVLRALREERQRKLKNRTRNEPYYL